MPALAEAGYRAVALDMRGYGRSSRPRDAAEYRYDHLAADLIAVMDHLGARDAVLFGHDFGANFAWHMGVHHAGRIRAIAPLCAPYAMELAGASDVLPSELYASIARQHFFHMHYYQADGVERANLGRERAFLMRLFWALCGEGDLLGWEDFPAAGTHYFDVLAEPERAPPWRWLSAEDFDFYVREYLAAEPELVFIGGISAYRAMDHNWRQFHASRHASLDLPVLFVGGAEDPVTRMAGPETFDRMRERVRDLRGCELLPGAGHFIQQEAPEALNALLLEFLAGL